MSCALRILGGFPCKRKGRDREKPTHVTCQLVKKRIQGFIPKALEYWSIYGWLGWLVIYILSVYSFFRVIHYVLA